MDKTAIKNFSIWARKKSIADVSNKATYFGITVKEIKNPLSQSTPDLQFIDIGAPTPTKVIGKEIEQRNALIARIKAKEAASDYKTAYNSVMEEVAYTWFNRLIAIRFMEVNDYLPSHTRVLSSDDPNKIEPDFVTNPFDTDLEFTKEEQTLIHKYKEENKLGMLFRMLFIKQCNKLNEILPELFEKTNDYSELLLNISFTDHEGLVYHLTHDISEDDFNVEKEGQIEIIGWIYQFYNTEPKDESYALLKKNVKITKERIPSVTQLFTPDWIVRYMVENSLGRLWVEGHPNDKLKSKWKYYIEEAEQEPSVKKQLAVIRAERKRRTPEDIKIIDPCMGSGHILVYAFDVLMQIYESEGYNPRDAAKLILEKNVYGLDIDRRAYQLACFSLMMKAQQYNMRIFTENIKLQLYHPAGFLDAEEYGSLVKVDSLPAKPELSKGQQMTLFDDSYDEKLCAWNFNRLLVQKYDVVVTNPPYMGGKGMGAKLSKFVKKNYPDSKSDLSTAFMEQTLFLCKPTGFMSMINIPVWMFLSSYEKLRVSLLSSTTFINLLHFGRGIFGADFGTTSFVIKASYISGYVGLYRKLYTRQGTVDNFEKKHELFFSDYDKYYICQDDYKSVPAYSIAYRANRQLLDAFRFGKRIDSFALPKQGLATANNNRFLRFWFEVPVNHCGFAMSQKEAKDSHLKWFPYNKGGGFQKWYGNNEYVVNWQNDGSELRAYHGSVIRNPQFYFKECLSWSKVTISGFSMRFIPKGFIFDVAGCSIFDTGSKMGYLLGFANSKVNSLILSIISPTINYEVGHIASLPILGESTSGIEDLVADNISLSRSDWDSYEVSWDFKKHPLICGEKTLAAAFAKWDCETTEQFNTLKANEEELNRIFIDIYDLQDELTPEVEEKDVSVRKADLGRDVRSFISYSVGCMLGRYSLDLEGLAYAGGDWDQNKYKTYIPDHDNCIPITDEEYFDDDIVSRLVDFVKAVYGKDTLEKNLEFIAKALGNRGDTPLKTIRNYFINEFYKDHVKIYQKRPIYWLFESGKENGFKALIYMHRYNADTIGNMRIEYIHKLQAKYESQLSFEQHLIDTSQNQREKSAAIKQKEKLIRQIKEIKDYDVKIAHLANCRIEIDLDDGVKVNYEKVQTGKDGKKLEVLGKI